MRNKQVFDILKGDFTKAATSLENYLVYKEIHPKQPAAVEIEDLTKTTLREPQCSIQWPRICVNDYLNDTDLKLLNEVKDKKGIKKFIDGRIPKACNEPSRTLFIELMYTVVKFSRSNDFDLKQTGALLSHFYLTHVIFTSSYNISAEKLYLYFKEIMLCHSAVSPPDSLKIFSMEESQNIMNFFFRIYLRNLPILRTMSLPNFAFYLDMYTEPEVPLPNAPVEKNKKKPKKKKKKKKK